MSKRAGSDSVSLVSVHRVAGDGTTGPAVGVTGEADISSAGRLRDDLLATIGAEPLQTWTIDLADLTFCDLAGLDALRDVKRRIVGAGSAPRWQRASELLRWLGATFPVYEAGALVFGPVLPSDGREPPGRATVSA